MTQIDLKQLLKYGFWQGVPDRTDVAFLPSKPTAADCNAVNLLLPPTMTRIVLKQLLRRGL